MMMRRTVVSALATLLATASLTLSAYAQQSSTAFTYQGFLRDNGQPANGRYDFRFALFDDATGGNQIGSVVFVEDVTVADGLFTVEVDFGAAPFNTGARRWIEIGVRPGNSTGGHSLLTPRIELTPVPYALYAQNVANNAVSANQLANDPNSLEKVSGGNLSITPEGFLKKDKQVYVHARTPRDVSGGGSLGNNRWALTQVNSGSYAFFPIRYATVVHNVGNGYNPQTGEFTAPVSGYYYIYAAAQVTSEFPSDNNRSYHVIFGLNIGAYSFIPHSFIQGEVGRQTIPVSYVAYLTQGQKVRAGSWLATGQRLVGWYDVGELVIYLLFAADEPQ